MLIDAAGLWYRSYYALPGSITAPDGRRSGAVRGFLDGLATLVRDYSPDRLICCLEGNWRPQWRVELIDTYKTARVGSDGGEDTPDGLDDQVQAITDILRSWGIATAEHPDYEADDVIATLRHNTDDEVVVVTGDRDLFQLVDDTARSSVVYLLRGISKARRYRAEDVEEKFGVSPAEYVEFAILRGDASDGLPGVTGIGDKGAATIVNRHPSLDSVVAAAEQGELKGRQNSAVLESSDYLRRAEQVTRCVSDVALPEVAGTIPRRPTDSRQLAALTEEWGIQLSVDRLAAAFGGGGT